MRAEILLPQWEGGNNLVLKDRTFIYIFDKSSYIQRKRHSALDQIMKSHFSTNRSVVLVVDLQTTLVL